MAEYSFSSSAALRQKKPRMKIKNGSSTSDFLEEHEKFFGKTHEESSRKSNSTSRLRGDGNPKSDANNGGSASQSEKKRGYNYSSKTPKSSNSNSSTSAKDSQSDAVRHSGWNATSRSSKSGYKRDTTPDTIRLEDDIGNTSSSSANSPDNHKPQHLQQRSDASGSRKNANSLWNSLDDMSSSSEDSALRSSKQTIEKYRKKYLDKAKNGSKKKNDKMGDTIETKKNTSRNESKKIEQRISNKDTSRINTSLLSTSSDDMSSSSEDSALKSSKKTMEKYRNKYLEKPKADSKKKDEAKNNEAKKDSIKMDVIKNDNFEKESLNGGKPESKAKIVGSCYEQEIGSINKSPTAGAIPRRKRVSEISKSWAPPKAKLGVAPQLEYNYRYADTGGPPEPPPAQKPATTQTGPKPIPKVKLHSDRISKQDLGILESMLGGGDSSAEDEDSDVESDEDLLLKDGSGSTKIFGSGRLSGEALPANLNVTVGNGDIDGASTDRSHGLFSRASDDKLFLDESQSSEDEDKELASLNKKNMKNPGVKEINVPSRSNGQEIGKKRSSKGQTSSWQAEKEMGSTKPLESKGENREKEESRSSNRHYSENDLKSKNQGTEKWNSVENSQHKNDRKGAMKSDSAATALTPRTENRKTDKTSTNETHSPSSKASRKEEKIAQKSPSLRSQQRNHDSSTSVSAAATIPMGFGSEDDEDYIKADLDSYLDSRSKVKRIVKQMESGTLDDDFSALWDQSVASGTVVQPVILKDDSSHMSRKIMARRSSLASTSSIQQSISKFQSDSLILASSSSFPISEGSNSSHYAHQTMIDSSSDGETEAISDNPHIDPSGQKSVSDNLNEKEGDESSIEHAMENESTRSMGSSSHGGQKVASYSNGASERSIGGTNENIGIIASHSNEHSERSTSSLTRLEQGKDRLVNNDSDASLNPLNFGDSSSIPGVHKRYNRGGDDDSMSDFSLQASNDILSYDNSSKYNKPEYEPQRMLDDSDRSGSTNLNQGLEDLDTNSFSDPEAPEEPRLKKKSVESKGRMKEPLDCDMKPVYSTGFTRQVARGAAILTLLAAIAVPSYFFLLVDNDNSRPVETLNPFPTPPTFAPSGSPIAVPSFLPRPPFPAPVVPAPVSPQRTRSPTLSPTRSNPIQTPPRNEIDRIREFLVSIFPSLESDFADMISPQYLALEWLAKSSNLDSYTDDRKIQRFALATFFFSTSGASWRRNDLWLSDADECQWYSRSARDPKCDSNGSIISIELDLNNLAGSIPSELALLSNLERLDLSRSGSSVSLSGSIPTALGLLEKLETANLRGNNLTGNIPTETGLWTNLGSLDLGGNKLSGPIPLEIGNMLNLSILNLDGNNLDGQLPRTMGSLTTLTEINVEGNSLQGPIPVELGAATLLENIHLSGNKFTILPSEIGQLSFLRQFAASNNIIGGTIPSQIGSLVNLASFRLEGNAMTGTIPTEIGNLVELQTVLDLSKNQLSGRLPTELGRLTLLRNLILFDNQFSGPVPESISALTRISVLRLESNNLSGTIPVGICALYEIIFPVFATDCAATAEVDCPCCMFCCEDQGDCTCQFLNTDLDFLCVEFSRSESQVRRIGGSGASE